MAVLLVMATLSGPLFGAAKKPSDDGCFEWLKFMLWCDSETVVKPAALPPTPEQKELHMRGVEVPRYYLENGQPVPLDILQQRAREKRLANKIELARMKLKVLDMIAELGDDDQEEFSSPRMVNKESIGIRYLSNPQQSVVVLFPSGSKGTITIDLPGTVQSEESDPAGERKKDESKDLKIEEA